eukprot:15436193-Alexandrium_andersonii.AAC.1
MVSDRLPEAEQHLKLLAAWPGAALSLCLFFVKDHPAPDPHPGQATQGHSSHSRVAEIDIRA